MWSSSEITWGREPTARMASRIEVARLPHSPQPTDSYEARADIGCPRCGHSLGHKPAWEICCLELDSLDLIFPLRQYCAWPFWPQHRPQKKPLSRGFQNQDCAWAKPTGGVHLEGTFRIATWGGRGTESLVGPVKVASETLSPVL